MMRVASCTFVRADATDYYQYDLRPIFAPWWSFSAGTVSYASHANPPADDAARQIIEAWIGGGFQLKGYFVATWNLVNIAFTVASGPHIMECILASGQDGSSYVIYQYPNDGTFTPDDSKMTISGYDLGTGLYVASPADIPGSGAELPMCDMWAQRSGQPAANCPAKGLGSAYVLQNGYNVAPGNPTTPGRWIYRVDAPAVSVDGVVGSLKTNVTAPVDKDRYCVFDALQLESRGCFSLRIMHGC